VALFCSFFIRPKRTAVVRSSSTTPVSAPPMTVEPPRGLKFRHKRRVLVHQEVSSTKSCLQSLVPGDFCRLNVIQEYSQYSPECPLQPHLKHPMQRPKAATSVVQALLIAPILLAINLPCMVKFTIRALCPAVTSPPVGKIA
jgi:hypothetical protein